MKLQHKTQDLHKTVKRWSLYMQDTSLFADLMGVSKNWFSPLSSSRGLTTGSRKINELHWIPRSSSGMTGC